MYLFQRKYSDEEVEFIRGCHRGDIKHTRTLIMYIFGNDRKTNKFRNKTLQKGFMIACAKNNRKVIEYLFKYASEKTKKKVLKIDSVTKRTKQLLVELDI